LGLVPIEGKEKTNQIKS